MFTYNILSYAEDKVPVWFVSNPIILPEFTSNVLIHISIVNTCGFVNCVVVETKSLLPSNIAQPHPDDVPIIPPCRFPVLFVPERSVQTLPEIPSPL